MNTPHPQTQLFDDQKAIRVTVPVTPEVRDAFKRLSAAQGVSVGKAMGEWLTDTLDGVLVMADLLERARKAPQLAVRELHAYATGLTDLTSELIREVQVRSSKQRTGGALEGPAEAGGAGAPSVSIQDVLAAAQKRSSKGLPPPVSNTGGKVGKKPKKAG